MSDEGPPGEMTLAFDVDALTRLEAPATVVRSARRWSSALGVIGEDLERANFFVQLYGVDPDFVEAEPTAASLTRLRERFETDRHVLVGTDADRATLQAIGWEFLSLEEAAEKAGWQLREGGRSWIGALVDGVVRRVLGR